MTNLKGNQLIEQLNTDPIGFTEMGKPYQLLKEYFRGLPLTTLRPLLSNNDKYIQSAAVFIVSELGSMGCTLIDDVLPLLNSDNRSIRYDALETVMICAKGKNISKFAHVVLSMQATDEVIRVLAMRLVANADELQLKEGIRIFDTDNEFHKSGLSLLLSGETLESEDLLRMIDDEHPLRRKYGIVAAKKFYQKFPELIVHGSSSSDPDLRKFSLDFLKVNPG